MNVKGYNLDSLRKLVRDLQEENKKQWFYSMFRGRTDVYAKRGKRRVFSVI